jgi:hypothetical protein
MSGTTHGCGLSRHLNGDSGATRRTAQNPARSVGTRHSTHVANKCSKSRRRANDVWRGLWLQNDPQICEASRKYHTCPYYAIAWKGLGAATTEGSPGMMQAEVHTCIPSWSMKLTNYFLTIDFLRPWHFAILTHCRVLFTSNPSEAYASTCPSTGPMSIDDGISTSLTNRQSSQLYRAEAKDVLLDGHTLTCPMLPLL